MIVIVVDVQIFVFEEAIMNRLDAVIRHSARREQGARIYRCKASRVKPRSCRISPVRKAREVDLAAPSAVILSIKPLSFVSICSHPFHSSGKPHISGIGLWLPILIIENDSYYVMYVEGMKETCIFAS